MIRFSRSLTISASPTSVWNVLERFMQIDEFAPLIASVDALTSGDIGVGSQRRCHFEDGNSLVEEVTDWRPGQSYRVQLSDFAPMPLRQAAAEIRITPAEPGKTRVVWSMEYQVKFGPLGWVLGQTMMKLMMRKVLDANLRGLADRATSPQVDMKRSA